MMTREDVMAYGAIGTAFCVLACGFCFDIHFMGTAYAFGVLAALSVVVVFLAYLDEPNSYDTRSARGG